MKNKIKFNFNFRRAVIEDAVELAVLLNGSYRGESAKEGWTTESDLVGGERTNSADVKQLIQKAGSHFILAIDNGNKQILGCVHVKDEDEMTVYFGMLAVRPTFQTLGIGKALIEQVQKYTQATSRKRIRISVLNLRKELIAYYNRLGFFATGGTEVFPNLADAKVPGLELLELVKVI